MSAVSSFRLRFPIVGDTNIFSSHIAARDIQCFSSITEWAGVLLFFFFLKPNSPPRYVLLAVRLTWSLNLPYFLRLDLACGERRARRPYTKSFPELSHANPLHSGHQRFHCRFSHHRTDGIGEIHRSTLLCRLCHDFCPALLELHTI